MKRVSVFLHQEYCAACSAAILYIILLFCTIKAHKKQKQKKPQQKQTTKKPNPTQTKKPSVHTWFSATKKDPIVIAFSCRNFEFLDSSVQF